MTTSPAPRSPQRTCVGCRMADHRDQLVRLVRTTPAGIIPVGIRVDQRGSAPGRGAWVHPEARCLDLAVRRGGIARSFRGALAREDLEEVIRAVSAQQSFIT